MDDGQTCFVISPIGSEGSETRERADKLLNYVISPVVDDKGYETVRADDIDEPGLITSQIIEYVVESDLVIADLTEKNANVFYELAVRHSLQKPTIQIIDDSSEIPFDIANTRTIQLDLSDPESVYHTQEQIRKQITSVQEGDYQVDTPISVAMTLRDLKQSTDPEERNTAEVVEEIQDLRTMVRSIQNELSNQRKNDMLNPSRLETSVETLLEIDNTLVELREIINSEELDQDDIERANVMIRATIHEIRNMSNVLIGMSEIDQVSLEEVDDIE